MSVEPCAALGGSIGRSTSPLMRESVRHEALKIYDRLAIPSDATIVLSSTVLDGVGDLENVIFTARHLSKLREKEPFRLIVWLNREQAVPDSLWEAKWAELSKWVDEICCLAICSKQLNRTALDQGKRIAALRPCVINVSTQSVIPYCPTYEDGNIVEYGMGANVLPRLDKLLTGLQEDTSGLWMSDDPVLIGSTRLSRQVQTQLFGSELSAAQIKEWEIGFASLRDDDARLAYIDLRLSQASHQNCSIAISPFHNAALEKEEIGKLISLYGFDSCVIVDRNGFETRIGTDPSLASGVLRIVHEFIDENDLPAVIRLAHEGSLGGAGDTSFVRGLMGRFPVFMEARLETKRVWQKAARFLQARDYPRLADWFEACLKADFKAIASLRAQEELLREWRDFRLIALKEMDLSPWIDRYVRRCVFVSRFGDKIRQIEKEFFEHPADSEKYALKIKLLVDLPTRPDLALPIRIQRDWPPTILEYITNQLSNDRFENAFSLAATISDPKIRSRAFRDVFSYYIRTDDFDIEYARSLIPEISDVPVKGHAHSERDHLLVDFVHCICRRKNIPQALRAMKEIKGISLRGNACQPIVLELVRVKQIAQATELAADKSCREDWQEGSMMELILKETL